VTFICNLNVVISQFLSPSFSVGFGKILTALLFLGIYNRDISIYIDTPARCRFVSVHISKWAI